MRLVSFVNFMCFGLLLLSNIRWIPNMESTHETSNTTQRGGICVTQYNCEHDLYHTKYMALQNKRLLIHVAFGQFSLLLSSTTFLKYNTQIQSTLQIRRIRSCIRCLPHVEAVQIFQKEHEEVQRENQVNRN